MKVFLDIEWIENGENSLTQLSAVRVDEDGERTNQLDILVRPHESAFAEPWHVAFGNYPAETFLSGVSERECMQQFRAWLYADDQIWVWVRSNKKRLIKAWEMHCAPEVLPEVRLMAKRARRAVFGDENEVGTPFELLRLLRIDPPRVEHRSCDDVEALRLLMNTLHLADKPAKAESQQNFTEQAVVPLALRRERNREMISRTQYSFLFLKNAEVFHRRGCSVCLNARETGDILGSVYYKTAAHMRRPCKICKPKPEVDEECSGVGGRKAPAESAYIKMLTGETVWRKRSKILGWCHCWRHPGAVDRELFKKHRCSEKECRHFQRNEECQYWVQLEALREKEKKKLRSLETREKERVEADEIKQLTMLWQSYLAEMNADMLIVRVEKEAPCRYKIFYVSDNRFGDAYLYSPFMSVLRNKHPRYRVSLCHIRNVDGNFATIEEYRCRRK